MRLWPPFVATGFYTCIGKSRPGFLTGLIWKQMEWRDCVLGRNQFRNATAELMLLDLLRQVRKFTLTSFPSKLAKVFLSPRCAWFVIHFFCSFLYIYHSLIGSHVALRGEGTLKYFRTVTFFWLILVFTVDGEKWKSDPTTHLTHGDRIFRSVRYTVVFDIYLGYALLGQCGHSPRGM